MLGHAFLMSRYAKTWLLPSCIYSLYWFLFTFFPLIIVPDAPASPLAILYILGSCVFFSLGALPFNWRRAHQVNATRPGRESKFDTHLLRMAFFAFSILSLVFLVANIAIQGVSLADLSSGILEVSNRMIAARYSQSTISNIFGSLANISAYVTVCLGGLIFPGFGGNIKRFSVLVASMLPPLLVMAILGAKGMLFLCIAFFYSGIIVRRVLRNERHLISRGELVRLIGAIIVIFPVVTLAFLARGLYRLNDQQAITDSVLRLYASYSSAHIYAFSDWFSWYVGGYSTNYYKMEPTTGGFYTFMTLFQAAGDNREVPLGVYDEYYSYGYYITSNIYTWFRGIITDFTIPGSCVFILFLGFLCHAAFSSLLNGARSISITLFMIMVGAIYMSFIIDLFIWSSPYALFASLWILLAVNDVQRTSQRTRSSQASPVGSPLRRPLPRG